MTCETAKDLIPLCIDDSASYSSISAVNIHLSVCPECRRYYKACSVAEKKLSPKANAKNTSKENLPNQADIDSKFNDLCVKLKRQRLIKSIVSAAVICAMAGYIIYSVIKITGKTK